MRVAVADDDGLVAMSLKTILEADSEVTVCAIGASGEEAVSIYREHKPDILLMDIRMAGMGGLAAGEQILKEDEDAKILYLTTFMDDEYIVKALGMGAKGYILKQEFHSIVPALKAVMSGQNVYGKDISARLPKLVLQRPSFDYGNVGITDKEYEIIEEVSAGLSNREIAGKLFLSEGTVRNYISGILDKLNLRDRTQLAVFYYKNK